MLEAGQHIQDRFVVEELVGRGGLAEVYRVRHLQLGSVHALKLLLFRKKSLADRLLLEGRIQAQLRHPNVVAVTDVVVHDGQYGLLMEYVDNVTLEELIDSKGPMPIDEALECIAPVLAGVDAAHKAGVLHRDLKPANVLLARVAGGLVPKVSDFGIAKVLDESLDSATRENVAMGTPGYMAPEQVLDARGVDARTDVFALAGMLYELVAGRRAFADESGEVTLRSTLEGTFLPLNEVVEGVPEHISDAVGQALSRERDDRPPSVQAFAEALLAEHDSLLAMFHGSGQTAPITLDPGQFSNPGTQPGTRSGTARSGSPVSGPHAQGPTILPPNTAMSAAPSPSAQQTYADGEVASDSARRHTDPEPAPSRRKGPPPLFLTGALLAVALLLLGGVGGVAAGFALGVFGPPDRDQPVDLGLTEPIEGSVRLKAGEEPEGDTDADGVAEASSGGAAAPVDTGSERATAAGGTVGGGAVDDAEGASAAGGSAAGDDGGEADTDAPSDAAGDTDAGAASDEADATTTAATDAGGTASSGTEEAGEGTGASTGTDGSADDGSAEPDPAPEPAPRPMVMPMDTFLASSWDGKVYRQPFTLRVLQERNGDVVAEGRIVLGAQQRILRLTGRYDPYTGAMYLKETNGDLLLQGTVSGSSIDGTYQREGRGKPSDLELVRR